MQTNYQKSDHSRNCRYLKLLFQAANDANVDVTRKVVGNDFETTTNGVEKDPNDEERNVAGKEDLETKNAIGKETATTRKVVGKEWAPNSFSSR